MRPVTVTTPGGGGFSTVIPMDINLDPFAVSIMVRVTGTVSFTVQHTMDDVFDPAFSPASAAWDNHASLVTLAVQSDGNYAFPVRGIRLNQISGAGTCSMTVTQAGHG